MAHRIRPSKDTSVLECSKEKERIDFHWITFSLISAEFPKNARIKTRLVASIKNLTITPDPTSHIPSCISQEYFVALTLCFLSPVVAPFVSVLSLCPHFAGISSSEFPIIVTTARLTVLCLSTIVWKQIAGPSLFSLSLPPDPTGSCFPSTVAKWFLIPQLLVFLFIVL